MIETYAFLAMFAVQILVMSYLHMICIVQRARAVIMDTPDAWFALSPGPDRNRVAAIFAMGYRVVQAIIAAVGLLVLLWLFNYMQRPDWDVATVIMLSVAYPLVTWLPIVLVALYAHASGKSEQFRKFQLDQLEGKRKAALRRRSVFDFVSPFTVSFAIGIYFLFVAFALYAPQSKPFKTLVFIGVLTLTCAAEAAWVYWSLYVKKRNPREKHEAHVRAIGREVRSSVYGFIVTVVFFFFVFTIRMVDVDLYRWLPFVTTALTVMTTLESYKAFTVSPLKLEEDAVGESPAH